MKSLLLLPVAFGLCSIFLSSLSVSGSESLMRPNPCPFNYTGPVPNPEDCHSFYLCVAGHSTLVPCPADLCYNHIPEQCDYCDHVPGCEIGEGTPPTRPPSTTTTNRTTTTPTTTTPTTTRRTTTTPTTTPTTTRRTTTTPTTTTTTTERPTPPNLPCPNVDFMMMPYPGDCRKYYICVNGVNQGVYTCERDLWFHFQQQTCTYPWDDICS